VVLCVRLVMTYVWKFGAPAGPAAAGPPARAPGLRLTVGPPMLGLLNEEPLWTREAWGAAAVCLLKRCSRLHAHDCSLWMMCF